MTAFRIEEFDTWRPGYAGATVHIKSAIDDSDVACFYDLALSQPAANPQTLLSYSQDGISYGKFSRPIYVGAATYLVINSIDRTGIVQTPITSLDEQDASDALVTAAGGSVARALSEIAADSISVLSQGEFLPVSNPSASASTNNATLVAAIGVASANGGGYVIVPEGVYAITSFSLPEGVILKGQSDGATVLQSTLAANVVTLSGDRAGLEDLVLDGVSNQAGSVGIYSKSRDRTRIRRVLVKRFESGEHMRGGNYADWQDFRIDSCVNGSLWHGDNDASGGANGDSCQHNLWRGGLISNCVNVGLETKYVDKPCWHNTISGVGFEGNLGVAYRNIGARWTRLEDDCWFSNNAKDITVQDGSDTTKAFENTVIGMHVRGGTISGDMTFTGKCQDIVFDGVELQNGTYTMTTVLNNILAIDCTESDGVQLAGGDSTKWVRARRQLGEYPGSSGITTDAVATEAWSYNLAPGERVHVEAVVIGNGRNTIDYAVYHIARAAHRPGSTLAYDAQTANFTAGQILTGATSQATARITADSDSGTTGTLTLRDITGEFVDNEIISDAAGGSATANGVLAHQNAALLGSTTSIETAVESDSGMNADFLASADEIRVLVAGAAAKVMEWTVSVKVTSG